MTIRTLAAPLFVAALATLPVACAPQPAGMAAPAPASSLSGPANTSQAATPTPGMAGMSNMDHSNMQGMDMNTMMAHCTQMRQGMRPGMAMSADMRQTMAQCDQMDRSMGMAPQRSR